YRHSGPPSKVFAARLRAAVGLGRPAGLAGRGAGGTGRAIGSGGRGRLGSDQAHETGLVTNPSELGVLADVVEIGGAPVDRLLQVLEGHLLLPLGRVEARQIVIGLLSQRLDDGEEFKRLARLVQLLP